MKSDAYNAPEIEELVVAQPIETPKVQEPITIKAIAAEVEQTSNEKFWRNEVDIYFRYLNGERGYSKDADRLTNNIGFMQRTGTMLSYDYKEFEDCILYLIQKLRNNPKASADGRFFRFLEGCEITYSHTAMAQYRLLMSWCIRVAGSWPTRVKLAKGTDIETMIVGMRTEAKDNLNLFVRKMANFAIQ